MTVRGRHTTLYDVELPSWLPREDVVTITRHYMRLVHAELEQLPSHEAWIQRFGPTQNRHPSGQSDSAFSSGTNISVDSNDSAEFI